jgi:hypothetical protein
MSPLEIVPHPLNRSRDDIADTRLLLPGRARILEASLCVSASFGVLYCMPLYRALCYSTPDIALGSNAYGLGGNVVAASSFAYRGTDGRASKPV